MKKIAITIPTYNRETLLRGLITSIPEDVTKYISDNGSFLSEKFEGTYKNTVLFRQENILGPYENWNNSIRIIDDADFFAISSDDDFYDKDKFLSIEKVINEYSEIDIFIFGNNFVDKDGQLISTYVPKKLELFEPGAGFSKFLYGIDVRTPSVFFKKSFIDRIGYFDDVMFTITAGDSELIHRALLLGRSAFIPSIVSSYRVWGGSETGQKIATELWMNEIDIWTDKIIELASKGPEIIYRKYNWNKYKDEIYARNLLAGLGNLYSNHKYDEVQVHFKRCRYPKYANFATKLRILKLLSMSKIRGFFVS